MSGVFGIDPQRTRTVIALAEGTEGDVHTRSVGDGSRTLVPNACGPEPLWGSTAADAELRSAGSGRGIDSTGLLDCWVVDPLSEAFLRGLRRRLHSYLGRTSPTAHHLISIALPPGTPAAAVRDRCTAAGLADALAVPATDALVCRWRADPASRDAAEGTVVAVACGEDTLSVAAYDMQRYDRRTWFEEVATRTARVGAGAVSDALARQVLGQCREGVPATALLAVTDGVWEFAAALRTRPPREESAWDGALADRLFLPLVLSREQLAGWPSATGVAAAATELVASLDVPTGRPVRTLVGGVGAVWPFVADALAPTGPVWRSPAPEHDLAFGAAWWPRVRETFSRSSTGTRAELLELPPARPTPVRPVPAGRPDPAALPPWERPHGA